MRQSFHISRSDPVNTGKYGNLVFRDKFLGCDFTEACKNHDRCYGTCHNGNDWGKTLCDENFFEDMMKEVNKSRWAFQQLCYEQARLYYNGVRNFIGMWIYRNAQEKACKKCQ